MNAVESILSRPTPDALADIAAPAPGRVALWLWNLDAAGLVTPAHLAVLSREERSRARRLRWPMLKRWFVLGRSRVRETLGRLTGLAPAAVRFATSSQGKLCLSAGLPRASRLRFNWSRSGHVLLLGVTFGEEIGVDLEQVRQRPGLHELAALSLPRVTQAALHSFLQDKRLVAFYRAWTRREAVAKACAIGRSGMEGDAALKIIEVETECDGVPFVGAVAITAV